MKTILAAMIGLLPIAALADGFATRDLRTLTPNASTVSKDFDVKATAAGRMTYFCPACSGLDSIDVLLGSDKTGEEKRFRSGVTTLDGMAERCKSRNATCKLTGAEFGRAVGWRTVYYIEALSKWGSTTVLFLDGDKVTVRSISRDASQALVNGEAVLDDIGPALIGKD